MKLLTDEDFSGKMIKALRGRLATLDLVRAVDCDLMEAKDPVVLEYASRAGRIVLSHDRRTMSDAGYDRIIAGLDMPGLILVRQGMPIQQFVEEMELVVLASDSSEYVSRVRFIPLQGA